MLFFHLHLGLRSDLLISDIRNKTLYAFLFQSGCHILVPTQSLWTDHRNESPPFPLSQWKDLWLSRLLRNWKNKSLFIEEYTTWISSLCSFSRFLLLFPSQALVSHTFLNTLLSTSIFFYFRDQALHPAKQQIMS